MLDKPFSPPQFTNSSTEHRTKKIGMVGYRVKPLTLALGPVMQRRGLREREEGIEREAEEERARDLGQGGTRKTEREKRDVTHWAISSNRPLPEIEETDFSRIQWVSTSFLNVDHLWELIENSNKYSDTIKQHSFKNWTLKPESLDKYIQRKAKILIEFCPTPMPLVFSQALTLSVKSSRVFLNTLLIIVLL